MSSPRFLYVKAFLVLEHNAQICSWRSCGRHDLPATTAIYFIGGISKDRSIIPKYSQLLLSSKRNTSIIYETILKAVPRESTNLDRSLQAIPSSNPQQKWETKSKTPKGSGWAGRAVFIRVNKWCAFQWGAAGKKKELRAKKASSSCHRRWVTVAFGNPDKWWAGLPRLDEMVIRIFGRGEQVNRRIAQTG